MLTLDQYLDLAIERKGLKSDRDLSRHLGQRGPAVSHYRTKRAWPSDDAMIKIATMAGLDPDRALLDLNTWRCSGEARQRYLKMASAMTGAGLFFGVLTAGGAAGTDPEQGNISAGPSIYYDKLKNMI